MCSRTVHSVSMDTAVGNSNRIPVVAILTFYASVYLVSDCYYWPHLHFKCQSCTHSSVSHRKNVFWLTVVFIASFQGFIWQHLQAAFPDSIVRNSLQRSIFNLETFFEFPTFNMHVIRAHSWKSDTLSLSYIIEWERVKHMATTLCSKFMRRAFLVDVFICL